MRVPTFAALMVCGVLAASAAVCSTSGTAATSPNSSTPGVTAAGSGDPQDSSTTAGTTPPGDGAGVTSSAPVAPGDSAAPIDVCSVMPVTAASAAAGQPFTSANASDSGGRGIYTCYYNGDGLHWSIAVYQSPSTLTLDDLLVDLGGANNAQPVSGIGDQAYVSPVGVIAQFGQRAIEVGSANNSASNEAGYESLAKATIAKLK